MIDFLEYRGQYERVLRRSPQLSDILPADWAEANVVIPGKGKLNYDFNPYCRDIINMFAPTHPARRIAVMKGSQITFSSGVIMPALGYIIAEDPHNSALMVGRPDLVKPAVEKLDLMIQGAKLQHLLRYQVQKKRNTKTGDTDEIKNFMNGYIKILANTNPKAIAQLDLLRIILDDFDAMTGTSMSAGDLLNLIEMRAASSKNDYKLAMISTPLDKATTNIEGAFLQGDQEYYMLECPCCHEAILLRWTIREGEEINGLTGVTASCPGGIVYERNNHGQVISKSVGYVCYRCGGWFNDRNKQNMLREGYWEASAVPFNPTYYSFHIPSLYAPAGMFDWEYYCNMHALANPLNGVVDDFKMRTLVNTCWGEPYEQAELTPDANVLQGNVRAYAIGTVPEHMSMNDGSGRIVMLVCAADLNGTKKDARIDYEVVGWAANGQRYSIRHGSVGTFVPGEAKLKHKQPRQRWTYEHGKANSVWPEFKREVLDAYFDVDTGRRMQVVRCGMDCRHHTTEAFEFIDGTEGLVVGLMGMREDTPEREDVDKAWYIPGKQRGGYYVLNVLRIKDRLSKHMQLGWEDGVDESQPGGFMNFPTPADGLYSFKGYFEHYGSEHRVLVKNAKGTDTRAMWVKKRSNVQNHFWDVAVYNLVMRDIAVLLEAKDAGMRGEDLKRYGFKEFAADITAAIEGGG